MIRWTTLVRIAAMAALGCASVSTAQGPGFDPVWSQNLGAGELGGVFSFIEFDSDSAGPNPPELYAGGRFKPPSTVPSRFARMVGSTWLEVGGGVDGDVVAMAIFDDDGPGPRPEALYIAGEFTTAGGVPAARIARWDGAGWEPLGGGLTNHVHALAVFDEDGAGPLPPALFAGGNFTVAGGSPCNFIARWDGSAWTPVGPLQGMNSDVLALFVYDDGSGPALYAGGTFTNIAGIGALRIARWNGAAWSSVGGGFGPSGSVRALAAYDDDGPGPRATALYAGGEFSSAGGLQAKNLARWDGLLWREVGSMPGGGVNRTINCMAVYDDDGAGPRRPALYLGGEFTSATFNGPTTQASRIVRWDGTSHEALGSGLNNSEPQCFAVFDRDGPGPKEPSLFVGGLFENAGGIVSVGVACWESRQWRRLGEGMNGPINAIASVDPDGPGGADPTVVAGGEFGYAGSAAATRVALLGPEGWEALGAGLNDRVYALAEFDADGPGPGQPHIYAGGWFTMAGSAPAQGLAKWNGAGWSAVSSGFSGTVSDLLVFDADGPGPGLPTLHVAGVFVTASGRPLEHVAAWDGQGWAGMSSGLTGAAKLAAFDEDGPGPGLPALFAAARVPGPSGSQYCVARFDGSAWSMVGAAMNDDVRTIAVYDEDGAGPLPAKLFAGGLFTGSGSVTTGLVAVFESGAWGPVGGGVGSGAVYSMVTMDPDGPGEEKPSLYAAGSFTSSGTTNRIAAWDGAAWSDLSGGMNGEVRALAVLDADGAGGPAAPTLYAGGLFTTAGGGSAERISALIGCSTIGFCYANCDGSAVAPLLNVNDFVCFQTRYAAGDEFANCDGSTVPPVLNVNDFICFMQQYSAGCP